MPIVGRSANRWNRRTAASRRGPKVPSNGPDGKPCQASLNWSSATSQPRRRWSAALRAGCSGSPSARRVRGPTMPSGSSPTRSGRRRALLVRGPRRPSTGPAYALSARSATCSAATFGAGRDTAACAELTGSATAAAISASATPSLSFCRQEGARRLAARAPGRRVLDGTTTRGGYGAWQERTRQEQEAVDLNSFKPRSPLPPAGRKGGLVTARKRS